MLLIVWILLIIMGLFYKKSKWIAFLEIMYSSLMMAFNSNNPDWGGYLRTFENVKISFNNIYSGNVLFNILLYIFGIFNNYNIALYGIVLLSFILLYKGIKYYTDSTAYVLGLYLIAPFVIDATQVKNFVAMSIWIYFSRYLYEAVKIRRVDRNTILYILGVAIATGVHYSFIFTLVFLVCIYLDLKTVKNFLLSIVLLLLSVWGIRNIYPILRLISNSGISFINIALKKMGDYEINYNFSNASARFKVTLLFFIIVLLFLFCINKLCISEKNKEYQIYLFVLKLTIVSVFIFPMLLYSQEMYRMQRNMLIFYYILIEVVSPGKIIVKKKLIVNRVISTAIGLILGVYYLYTDSIIWNYETVFVTLFRF